MQIEGDMLEEMARKRLNEPIPALRYLNDVNLFAHLIYNPVMQNGNLN